VSAIEAQRKAYHRVLRQESLVNQMKRVQSVRGAPFRPIRLLACQDQPCREQSSILRCLPPALSSLKQAVAKCCRLHLSVLRIDRMLCIFQLSASHRIAIVDQLASKPKSNLLLAKAWRSSSDRRSLGPDLRDAHIVSCVLQLLEHTCCVQANNIPIRRRHAGGSVELRLFFVAPLIRRLPRFRIG